MNIVHMENNVVILVSAKGTKTENKNRVQQRMRGKRYHGVHVIRRSLVMEKNRKWTLSDSSIINVDHPDIYS